MTDDEYIKLLLSEAHRHDQMARIMQDQALAEGHRLVACACRRGAQCMGGGKICKTERKRRFARLRFWMSAGRYQDRW